jgi:MinD superfamily P-loop ATPase
MKIAIASGKGGTGKTTLSTNLANYLAGENDVVLTDLDVDAADMHLLMQPDFNNAEDFYSGLLVKINRI